MSKILNELTIEEAVRGLRAKEFSVHELWDACHTAATAQNGELNAYLEIFDANVEAIREAQRRIDEEGDRAPHLCGIPLAIKDNILIEGKHVSAASKILEPYIATYDATIIKKLKGQGALFVGRTNMDEFAMGSSTEHSAFGPVKNPVDTSRVPGGSSGGSASAVAAHMCLGALGSDTGGSIRQPASHTGIVGLKPTYGAVSRYGLIALGSSLDQIGPLAKSVADARLLYEAITGHDPLDSTTLVEGTYPKRNTTPSLRIGVPRHLLQEGVDADVKEAFERSLTELSKAGHTVVEVDLPTSSYALPAYYVIMPAEASANLARLDGVRYGYSAHGDTLLEDYIRSRTEGFGEETRRRILLGTFVLSSGYIDAYYRKANAARAVLRKEYDRAFESCDVIATPTTPAPAFKFGEKNDPVAMYLEDIFTVTADLTLHPALSVPMGTVERGGSPLPIGMHFCAPHQAEHLLFGIGAALEKTQ
jgi:aspartyl-tRNA(Asn)/glutamyl-tRNA(Gln) amidotransferase subunit A